MFLVDIFNVPRGGVIFDFAVSFFATAFFVLASLLADLAALTSDVTPACRALSGGVSNTRFTKSSSIAKSKPDGWGPTTAMTNVLDRIKLGIRFGTGVEGSTSSSPTSFRKDFQSGNSTNIDGDDDGKLCTATRCLDGSYGTMAVQGGTRGKSNISKTLLICAHCVAEAWCGTLIQQSLIQPKDSKAIAT